MLYFSQALDDQRVLDHNQAMLDRAKSTTAEIVKDQLADAFAKWDGSGGAKTKKRLAELCTASVKEQRTCTPQAVNGWFSTGRIDKYWLPAVSSVLGARIGVVVDLYESQHSDSHGVDAIFARLAELLSPLGGSARKQAKAILEDFAMKPEDHKRMATEFSNLLGGSLKSKPAASHRKAA